MPKFAQEEEKSGKLSGRLSMAPSLDNAYVQSQLEKSVGTQVPQELANAIVETGQASKVREIAEALEKIIEYSGMESAHAVKTFADESLSKAFVSSPESFVSIAEAAKKGTKEAFNALRQEDIFRAFSKNPEKTADAFIRIAQAAGAHQADAFWTLGRNPLAAAFAKEMEKTTSSLVRICTAAGEHADAAFWALLGKATATAFVKNMEKTTKALERIGNAAGEHAGDAFYLLGSMEVAPLFAKNPSRVADSFVSIAEAAGKHSGKIFSMLEKKGVIEHFAKNMRSVAEAFTKISNSTGIGKQYAFYAICTKEFIGGGAATPSQLADAFVESARICGRNNEWFFYLISKYEMLRKPLAADISRITKFADAFTYTNFSRHIGKAISEKDEESMAKLMRRLDNPAELAANHAIPQLMAYRSKWKEGRELARAAGVTIEDREVFINFAYAKDTIGEEKAKALYKEFGIEYFARHSKKELESNYEHIGEKADPKPLLIIFYSKFDDYNALYRPEQVGDRTELNEKGYYNSIIIEVENKKEFYANANKLGKKYFGIGDILLVGHGKASSIQLGPGVHGEPKENYLDLSDLEELKELSGLFSDDARVFLASCFTGKDEQAIGGRISEAWGAELFGPRGPTAIDGFILEDSGRIKKPEYRGESSRFYEGVEVSPL